MTDKELKKQEPFLIDMTAVTSEMLGRCILGKLETTQAWVVPIYDGEDVKAERLGRPDREKIAALLDDYYLSQSGSDPEERDSLMQEDIDQILLLFPDEQEIKRQTRWEVGEELCCLIGNKMLEDMEAGKLLGNQLEEYMKHYLKEIHKPSGKDIKEGL